MTTDDPLALGVLRHLASTRGPDDPLASMARRVLSGRADLREAATWSWHGEAMATAFSAALRERDRMTPAQRATYDQQAAAIPSALREQAGQGDHRDQAEPGAGQFERATSDQQTATSSSVLRPLP